MPTGEHIPEDEVAPNTKVQSPPLSLMVYIVIPALISVALLLTSQWCPLNVGGCNQALW